MGNLQLASLPAQMFLQFAVLLKSLAKLRGFLCGLGVCFDGIAAFDALQSDQLFTGGTSGQADSAARDHSSNHCFLCTKSAGTFSNGN